MKKHGPCREKRYTILRHSTWRQNRESKFNLVVMTSAACRVIYWGPRSPAAYVFREDFSGCNFFLSQAAKVSHAVVRGRQQISSLLDCLKHLKHTDEAWIFRIVAGWAVIGANGCLVRRMESPCKKQTCIVGTQQFNHDRFDLHNTRCYRYRRAGLH